MKAKYIFEKFTQESDPIKDMGIGVFTKHDFKTYTDLFDYVADNIDVILGYEKLPPDLFLQTRNGDTRAFKKRPDFSKMYNYILEYTRVNGEKPVIEHIPQGMISNLILRLPQHTKYVIDVYDLRDKVEENLNEKFTEEGDPIADMGIGEAEITFSEIINPIIEEYVKEYGDTTKNITGFKKYFTIFKKEISKIILGKYVKGNMWLANRGWVRNKQIKVIKIKGNGVTLFDRTRRHFPHFQVMAEDFPHFQVMAEDGNVYALYAVWTYKITNYPDENR